MAQRARPTDVFDFGNWKPGGQTKRVWLWPVYLPTNVGIFDGDPGIGKSMVTVDLAARISKGLAWPDGTKGGKPGRTLFFCSEDEDDDIGTRLYAHGADMTKCRRVVRSFKVDTTDGLRYLEEKVKEFSTGTSPVKLVVIDPIADYMTRMVGPGVRDSMVPLNQLAARMGLTIILIRHPNKTGGRSAKTAGTGDKDFLNVARFGYLFATDSNMPGRVFVANTKMNLGPTPDTRAFSIRATGDNLAKVEWEDKAYPEVTANDLMSRPASRVSRDALSEAVEWLDGWMSTENDDLYNPNKVHPAGAAVAGMIKNEAGKSGISARHLREAKVELGIKHIKIGHGWIWYVKDFDPFTYAEKMSDIKMRGYTP